jgi:hypothetical protein
MPTIIVRRHQFWSRCSVVVKDPNMVIPLCGVGFTCEINPSCYDVVAPSHFVANIPYQSISQD